MQRLSITTAKTRAVVSLLSLFALGVFSLAAEADASIQFDAVSSTSDAAVSATLSWQHTIGGGNKRLLVVGLACEDASEPNSAVAGVTYNGVSMTEVAGSSVRVDGIKADLYYLLDANLPSAGTYTVLVTYSGNVDSRVGGAISLANVEQQAAEAVVTNTIKSTDISTSITTLTDGAWVIDVVGHQHTGSFTTTASGMLERWDANSEGNTGAGSTKPVISAGSTTMSWHLEKSAWIVHSAAAFAPQAFATVPDVVGQTETDANSAIVAADLTVGTITYDYNNTVPAGYVISQEPAAYTSVLIGSAVNLVISSGLPEVPNVVGMSEPNATAAITAVDNLVVGSVTYDYNDTVPVGYVISQDPAAYT
ncbi:MAG: PASTA domain-containing protein, partial [Planctomycetota bacterium]